MNHQEYWSHGIMESAFPVGLNHIQHSNTPAFRLHVIGRANSDGGGTDLPRTQVIQQSRP